jgi:formamidopyrimidine-DNA glycosylase
MPELPEVETLKRQLNEQAVGQKIKQIIIQDNRLFKGISSGDFCKTVTGKTIQQVLRRGKVLVLQLESRLFLILHLRISGWLMLSQKVEPFARVLFKLSNNQILQFCDSRILGEIKLIDDWQKLPIIQAMGPEPLTIKKQEFIALFANKKTKIKPLLMDQNFIAGIGNIYAQEALFCAKLHPGRGAEKISRQELGKLYDCLKKILKKAISCQGSSSDTYRQIDGNQGTYCCFHAVYQRQNKPCLICKTPLQRSVLAGRGTVFCPKCQK